jgi:hypothetical protein
MRVKPIGPLVCNQREKQSFLEEEDIMMKKLSILLLLLAVLGVAGTASAATSLWKGDGSGNGDWSVGTNWISQGPPSATGSTWAFRSGGGTSNITVSSSATQLYFYLGYSGTPTNITMTSTTNATVHINPGVELRSTKGTHLWSTQAGAVSTLEVYGTYNGGTAASASMNLYLASGTGSTGTHTIKVYGTLNEGQTATSGTLAIVNTGTAATNKGIVDIYNNGVVNTKAYVIGTAGTGKIYIDASATSLTQAGVMWINGNVTSQVAADITGHKIQAATFDGSGNFVSAVDMTGGMDPGTSFASRLTTSNYGYDSTLTKTWVTVQVPEPATIALLGLGSLLFLRKKR